MAASSMIGASDIHLCVVAVIPLRPSPIDMVPLRCCSRRPHPTRGACLQRPRTAPFVPPNTSA